jgi:hypothetical protein
MDPFNLATATAADADGQAAGAIPVINLLGLLHEAAGPVGQPPIANLFWTLEAEAGP